MYQGANLARAVLCILAMAALCAAPSATGASTASAKWTSRYTRLGTETKSLPWGRRRLLATKACASGEEQRPRLWHAVQAGAPKEADLIGNATTDSTPPEPQQQSSETGLVLFRVSKDEVRGMDVSRATLSLHIRRYDLELDRVDFYYLDQTWKSATSTGAVLENLSRGPPLLPWTWRSRTGGLGVATLWTSRSTLVEGFAGAEAAGRVSSGGLVQAGRVPREGVRAYLRQHTPAEGLPPSRSITGWTRRRQPALSSPSRLR